MRSWPSKPARFRLLKIKKLLSPDSSLSRKGFEAELMIISRVRHRNLVQLIGWCDGHEGLMLVYELVPGGSLDQHIHHSPTPLTWSERHKIILGLGSALRYLHLEWEQCVLHGDIKPSNIMLDSSLNAKLGDFGLARLVDHGTSPRTTALVIGSKEYIDPDFCNTGRPSTQSDVYSFGIVLLEIVTGRPPAISKEGSAPVVLWKWVWDLYSQGATLDAADPRLRPANEAHERQMERALVVGLWCVSLNPAVRPTVDKAMQVLQSEDAKLPTLSPEMYNLVALPMVTVSESGASSGVGSSATTGTAQSS